MKPVNSFKSFQLSYVASDISLTCWKWSVFVRSRSWNFFFEWWIFL